MGNKFGWHSGVLTCKDAKIGGDLYVQDDIVFSDVSAGVLGITGGIDMGGTVSAVGLDMDGITSSTAAIDIQGSNITGRAIRIGVKDTGLKISTTGFTLDEEPSNNYLFGLFSAVEATEATSSDELRSAWIRTRVDTNCDIGSSAGWGYGICGAEIQLKFYGGTTEVHAWQNSAVWAQLESQAATTTFEDGSYTQCVLANIGLTSATLAAGAVIAGVTINANTASLTNTGDAYYGLFITDKNTTSTDFTSGIWIADSVATTGITVGICTTGLSIVGATGDAISITTSGKFAMGAQGTGLPVTTAAPHTMQVHTLPVVALDAYTSSFGIRSRYEISTNQTNIVTIEAIDGRLRPKANMGQGNYCGVHGHVECSDTVTMALVEGILAAGHFTVEMDNTMTLTNGYLAGVGIDSAVHGSVDVSNVSYSGLRIWAGSGKEPWTNGISISDCVTSIYFGTPTSEFFKFVDDDTFAADAGDKGSTAGGYITVKVGTATRYINLVTGA